MTFQVYGVTVTIVQIGVVDDRIPQASAVPLMNDDPDPDTPEVDRYIFIVWQTNICPAEIELDKGLYRAVVICALAPPIRRALQLIPLGLLGCLRLRLHAQWKTGCQYQAIKYRRIKSY